MQPRQCHLSRNVTQTGCCDCKCLFQDNCCWASIHTVQLGFSTVHDRHSVRNQRNCQRTIDHQAVKITSSSGCHGQIITREGTRDETGNAKSTRINPRQCSRDAFLRLLNKESGFQIRDIGPRRQDEFANFQKNEKKTRKAESRIATTQCYACDRLPAHHRESTF